MIWQDKGFLLSKNKYNENSSIVEFYTENHGKVIGILFGASSKKIKNYLLIGNKFHLNYNSKNNGKIGYFKIEIDHINTPLFLENKKKLCCIIYTMDILKILTAENQENKNVYFLIENYFNNLKQDDWLIKFIFWELKLFKNLGYQIDFINYAKNEIIDGKEIFIVKSNKKIIPNFLVDKISIPKSKNEITNAFKLIGDFLEKTILKPNNLNYPNSRLEFLNLIK